MDNANGIEPLQLWVGGSSKASEVAKNFENSSPTFNINKSDGLSMPNVWSALVQLSPTARAYTVNKLIQVWPYPSEKYAFMVTPVLYMFGSSFSTAFISHHLYKEFKLSGSAPRHKVLFTSSIIPSVFATLASFITVRNPIMCESEPQTKGSYFRKQMFINVSFGVLWPSVAIPTSCAGRVRAKRLYNIPPTKTVVDTLTMAYVTMKPFYIRFGIPFMVFQALLAISPISVYFWARNQIIPQLERDQELFEELCVKAQIVEIPGIVLGGEDSLIEADPEQTPILDRLDALANRIYPKKWIRFFEDLAIRLKFDISKEDRAILRKIKKMELEEKWAEPVAFEISEGFKD